MRYAMVSGGAYAVRLERDDEWMLEALREMCAERVKDLVENYKYDQARADMKLVEEITESIAEMHREENDDEQTVECA